MYHGLRLHLSRSIVSHTHDMWYLARVIDDNFTHTSEVVLSRTWRTIVVQELGFVCMTNLYSLSTLYRRNWGIIRDIFTLRGRPYFIIILAMSHMRNSGCRGPCTRQHVRILQNLWQITECIYFILADWLMKQSATIITSLGISITS